MSTGKIITTQERIVQLSRMREYIFHTGDLANIWQIKNKNTLYTLLKRYTQRGLLYRIYKGLYSTDEISKLDPYLLGVKAMHSYCYVSTETVLHEAGIIAQKINYITLIGQKSKKFSIGGNHYYCRKLNDRYLLQDAGVIKKNNVNTATLERAVADLLYFNPRAHFDARGQINWDKVQNMQKLIGYKKL